MRGDFYDFKRRKTEKNFDKNERNWELSFDKTQYEKIGEDNNGKIKADLNNLETENQQKMIKNAQIWETKNNKIVQKNNDSISKVLKMEMIESQSKHDDLLSEIGKTKNVGKFGVPLIGKCNAQDLITKPMYSDGIIEPLLASFQNPNNSHNELFTTSLVYNNHKMSLILEETKHKHLQNENLAQKSYWEKLGSETNNSKIADFDYYSNSKNKNETDTKSKKQLNLKGFIEKFISDKSQPVMKKSSIHELEKEKAVCNKNEDKYVEYETTYLKERNKYEFEKFVSNEIQYDTIELRENNKNGLDEFVSGKAGNLGELRHNEIVKTIVKYDLFTQKQRPILKETGNIENEEIEKLRITNSYKTNEDFNEQQKTHQLDKNQQVNYDGEDMYQNPNNEEHKLLHQIPNEPNSNQKAHQSEICNQNVTILKNLKPIFLKKPVQQTNKLKSILLYQPKIQKTDQKNTLIGHFLQQMTSNQMHKNEAGFSKNKNAEFDNFLNNQSLRKEKSNQNQTTKLYFSNNFDSEKQICSVSEITTNKIGRKQLTKIGLSNTEKIKSNNELLCHFESETNLMKSPEINGQKNNKKILGVKHNHLEFQKQTSLPTEKSKRSIFKKFDFASNKKSGKNATFEHTLNGVEKTKSKFVKITPFETTSNEMGMPKNEFNLKILKNEKNMPIEQISEEINMLKNEFNMKFSKTEFAKHLSFEPISNEIKMPKIEMDLINKTNEPNKLAEINYQAKKNPKNVINTKYEDSQKQPNCKIDDVIEKQKLKNTEPKSTENQFLGSLIFEEVEILNKNVSISQKTHQNTKFKKTDKFNSEKNH